MVPCEGWAIPPLDPEGARHRMDRPGTKSNAAPANEPATMPKGSANFNVWPVEQLDFS